MSNFGNIISMLALCGLGSAGRGQTLTPPTPEPLRGAETERSAPRSATSETDSKVQALITKVGQALHKVQSLTADVNIVDVPEPDSSSKGPAWPAEKSSGNISFKRPNLFRFEQRDSAGKTSGVDILDGKTLWSVYPAVPQLNRRMAPPTMEGAFSRQGNPLLKYIVLRTQDFADTADEIDGKLRYLGTEGAGGTDYQVLEAKGPLETVRWFVGEDGLVHRVQTIVSTWKARGYGKRRDVALLNMRINAPIKEAVFAVPHLPKAQVLDLDKIPDPFADKELPVGTTAPDFNLRLVGPPEVNGSRTILSQMANNNKATLLYFWTMSCGACHYSLPHLQQLHDQFKDKGLAVVGVYVGIISPPFNNGKAGNKSLSAHTNPAEIKEPQYTEASMKSFMDEHGYTFPMAMDIAGSAFQAYKVKGYGTAFLLDSNGKVVWRGLLLPALVRPALTKLTM